MYNKALKKMHENIINANKQIDKIKIIILKLIIILSVFYFLLSTKSYFK